MRALAFALTIGIANPLYAASPPGVVEPVIEMDPAFEVVHDFRDRIASNMEAAQTSVAENAILLVNQVVRPLTATSYSELMRQVARNCRWTNLGALPPYSASTDRVRTVVDEYRCEPAGQPSYDLKFYFTVQYGRIANIRIDNGGPRE